MILRTLLIAAAALCLAQAAHAADAPLQNKPRAPYRAADGQIYRYVYAEAWYGNQKIVAPVRRVGCCDQVQVPGGYWIDCEFSCEITVRRLRLGYWQDQGAGYSTQNAPYPRADYYKGSSGIHWPYLF